MSNFTQYSFFFFFPFSKLYPQAPKNSNSTHIKDTNNQIHPATIGYDFTSLSFETEFWDETKISPVFFGQTFKLISSDNSERKFSEKKENVKNDSNVVSALVEEKVESKLSESSHNANNENGICDKAKQENQECDVLQWKRVSRILDEIEERVSLHLNRELSL